MRKDASVEPMKQLDWSVIFRSDQLYSNPIPLMKELYQHGDLARTVVEFIRFLRD